ncbi:MAG: hypothetical protein WA843_03260 [Candidatus Saccharimonadales bacterium]
MTNPESLLSAAEAMGEDFERSKEILLDVPATIDALPEAEKQADRENQESIIQARSPIFAPYHHRLGSVALAAR